MTSGFLLSLDPDPRFLQTGVTDLTGGIDTGAFSVTASGLVAGKKYYFRAYAINGEGISYGSDAHFTTIADLQPGWIGATPGRPRTGGRALGWGGSSSPPTGGSCTKNWDGSSPYGVHRLVFGSGWTEWGGSGRTIRFIPFSMEKAEWGGSISSACTTGRACSTTIN